MVKRDAQGRMYTVADAEPIDLAKARRECLDRIQGNEQFHVDTLGPEKPAPEAEPIGAYRCDCIAGLYICDECSHA